MARKLRIEMAGYYHVINRGVERRVVFYDKDDFEYFVSLLSNGCKKFNIILHNYCLMSNHYHLLIELKEENFSKFMRDLNSLYAIYFNKKYDRSGHLWQGRFKSWYVTNEVYFYILMKYIEQNPLKAKMVEKIENYPYSSSYYFFRPHIQAKHLENSWVIKSYKNDVKEIEKFFSFEIDRDDLKELEKASNLIETQNIDEKMDTQKLSEFFNGIVEKEERNKKVIEAYIKGYSQYSTANFIGISQPAVNKIIKKNSS